ncbi:hypothetical protein ACHAQJ_003466 [Trichoderma viride]
MKVDKNLVPSAFSLSATVISQLERKLSSGDEAQHVKVWEKQFDDDYMIMDKMQPEAIGRDFVGWTSIYDGSDMDKREMNEWLDDTIESILNGGESIYVLDIGTGSGTDLFNLTLGLQSYIGVEPSARAVSSVAKIAESLPTLADRVKGRRYVVD